MLRNLNQSVNGKRVLGVPQVGVPASSIPAHNAAYPDGLLTNKISAGDAADTLYKVIVSQPSQAGAVVLVQENGVLQITGADGTYTGTEDVWKYSRTNGISHDTGAYSATIGGSGATSGSAPGALLTGTSTFSGGAATTNAAAPGFYATSSSTFSAGAASGSNSVPGSAPGAILNANSSFTPGTAAVSGGPLTAVTLDANLIPKHRWITFEGNTRAVTFEGNTRVITFEGNNRTVQFDKN